MKMKKPLKPLLWVLILIICILLIAVFSSVGYKRAEEVAIESDTDSIELNLEEDGSWIINPSNSHYYKLTASMNWLQAETQAVEWGGHLVTINDADENAWLVSTFGSSETFWIGYTDKDVEGSWKWISGEDSTYTNWRHYVGGSEPNDVAPGEDAATINFIYRSEYLPGKWNDLPINSTMRGIVEKTVTELPKGKITFISDRDGNDEIYIMNVDGSEQTRLTNNTAEDWWPCFSPDRSKIAFMSNRDGNYEIYIMNVNGSEQKNLTNNPKSDSVPSFSPDGSKIVFESDRDGNGEIYIMNVDGSEQTRLTNNQVWDLMPSFSPNGSKIAFRSDRDANGEIYTFSSGPDVNWEIYIMNVDGSEQTRLTNNQICDWMPSFSPDGSKIAFVSGLSGNSEIYIMNIDGSDQTNLTINPATEWDPHFSPDGSKIAFASNRDGNFEIYIMNVDGSDQTRLTNNSADDKQPCFFFGESGFRSTGPLVPEITTYIPTPLDISTQPAVLGTNLLLAAITMLPFAVAAGFFTRTLSENEEVLKRKMRKMRKMRLVAWFINLKERIESIVGTKVGRHHVVRNIAQLLGVILFYGLVFSLLDRTWNPFSLTGLVLFLNMTIAYGIVGIADDIMQWRALKKWGVPADLSVRPTNVLISIASISASRLLAIVPGMMFGTPEALRVDKSNLDEAKRNRLPIISAITFFAIGFGLWLLTIPISLIQRLSLSDTVANLVSGFEGFLLVIFAVALQNTFVQMLGFPGGFGQALRKKNRWLWIGALIGVTFVFIHTLINPHGKLAKALQETSVILFLSVVVTFIIITFGLAFGLRLYFRKKGRLR
jgi:WD40 repeat protein/uncharacterized membrane protein YdcZ (DUF606 family)